MSRVARSIIWRRQAIAPDVQECIAVFLTTGAFPACHASREASDAWHRFHMAYAFLKKADPESAPTSVPFPRLVFWHSIDRAHDTLTMYLQRPLEERVDLHKMLGIETGAVLSQEQLEELHAMALHRTFKPAKRRAAPGQLELDMTPPPPPSSGAFLPVHPPAPPPSSETLLCDECNTEHVEPTCPMDAPPPAPAPPKAKGAKKPPPKGAKRTKGAKKPPPKGKKPRR